MPASIFNVTLASYCRKESHMILSIMLQCINVIEILGEVYDSASLSMCFFTDNGIGV